MALSYREIVAELEARGVMPDRPPGLEAEQKALERLGLRFDPSRVIIVAGTNGKGSVSITLEALFRSAGERVGLYTSPHLVETTERIRLDGREVSREAFALAFERVASVTADLKLTHFEMLTAMAAWLFASRDSHERVDRVILEVGLGGTWDATNAIPHSLCVITRLGLDHQNLLGSTLKEIAENKFGVISQEATVVHAPLDHSLHGLAAETRKRTQSTWKESEPFKLIKSMQDSLPVYRLQSRWGEVELSLPGLRAAENAALALTAFEVFGGNPAQHLPVLSRIHWPGRMQQVRWPGARCRVFLSGDHNPQGVESLLELLGDYPRKRLHLLTGIGVEKDADGMLRRLQEVREVSLYLTETPFKGRKLAEYGSWLSRVDGAWANPKVALSEVIKRADSSDLVVVTGSLYLVGEILKSISTAEA